MALWLDYAKISSGSPFTTIDVRDTTKLYNNAQNALGSVYAIPCNPASIANGAGSALVIKYVRYLSTTNAAVVGGPAPVYYTDETYTVVTGTASESAGGVNGVAGLLLPNTVSISGFTAAQLNGNFVWIALVGFVPACIAPGSTAAGDYIIGASGNFTPARVAAGTASTNVPIGIAASAVASSLCDIVCMLPVY